MPAIFEPRLLSRGVFIAGMARSYNTQFNDGEAGAWEPASLLPQQQIVLISCCPINS